MPAPIWESLVERATHGRSQEFQVAVGQWIATGEGPMWSMIEAMSDEDANAITYGLKLVLQQGIESADQ